MNDPIVDDVRRIREAHGARFNFDLWAIFRDIKEQQERSGLTFVSFADQPAAASPESSGLTAMPPHIADPVSGGTRACA